MNFTEYQSQANRTAKQLHSVSANLMHAALGLCTETGEFTTEVKRAHIYGKPITTPEISHMVEELGDILWYIALAANALGVPMRRIAEANIAKLQARYPEAYSDVLAEARLDKSGATPRES